ncbi:hypothetical protein IH982_02155 [Patescibacteria group bacterium]|nr:hypothetical protein [Patescibacteria group bacterium]
MKNMKQLMYSHNFLKSIKVFVLVGAGIVLSIFFIPEYFFSTGSVGEPKEPEISSMVMSSELDDEARQTIMQFIKNVFREEFLPEGVVFQRAPLNSGGGNEYVGSWNKDNRFFTVLYVEDSSSKTPTYIRGWTFALGTVVDETRAISLMAGVFTDQFIPQIDTILCQKLSDPQNSSELTNCGVFRTTEDGKKGGIDTRAPVITPDGQKVIMIIVCSVPKEFAPLYTATFCL